MKCPKCQAENREGVKFCGDCGQSLRLEIVCPQCGSTNPQGKRFCDKCGRRLAEANPPSIGPVGDFIGLHALGADRGA